MTYMKIGQASPNAEVVDEPCFVACRSPHRQPTSNFAVVESIDEETLSRVRRFAENQKLFYLYSFLPEEENPNEERMARYGFRHATLLHCLAGSEPQGGDCELQQLGDGFDGRLAVTRFMAQQFFSTQPEEVRDVVACATAATDLPLWRFVADGEIVGAAMSNASYGVFGIYNVCVASGMRGRGVGTQILNALIRTAMGRGLVPALQCDRRLAPFYEGFGMKSSGIVDVWSLDR